MIDVEINGSAYQVGRLDVFAQFHVARLMGPRIGALSMIDLPPEAAGARVGSVLTAVMGSMSREDSDFVVNACLAVVKKRQGQALSPITAPNGAIMFQDMDLDELMQIVAKVLEVAKLPDFFRADSPNSGDAPK